MAFTTKSGRTETSLSEINVTPFVDVVLVLLIIFMITAPVLQSGIEVTVPKTKVVKERLVISITKGQEVYLNSDHVRLDQIGDALRKKFRDPRGQAVYVRADENVAFGAFATVMSAVKAAGITNVSIVTEPIQPPKK
jgi:biopolymer transport protein TolR